MVHCSVMQALLLSAYMDNCVWTQRHVPPRQHNSCNFSCPDIVAMSVCIGIHTEHIYAMRACDTRLLRSLLIHVILEMSVLTTAG